MRNEKALHGSTESLVQVKDAAIHMNEYHIVVEEKTVYDSEGKNHKDCQIDADQAWGLLFVIVVVETEIVSEWPGLVKAINYQNYVRVEQGHNTVPTYNLVEHPRHAV